MPFAKKFRAMTDVPFPGEPIQLSGGQLLANTNVGLTAWVCPYVAGTQNYVLPYRLALRGTVPEPGTSLGLGVGLLVVLALARRKLAT